MRAFTTRSVVALLVASSLLAQAGAPLAASGGPGFGSGAGQGDNAGSDGAMGYGRWHDGSGRGDNRPRGDGRDDGHDGAYGRGDGDTDTGAGEGDVDDGQQRWIDIVNRADQPIYYVQISNIDDPYYGPDLLGPHTIIDAHAELRVEPRGHGGYCRFDVLLTYQDGTEVAISDVNLCEATDIMAWDNGTFDVVYVG